MGQERWEGRRGELHEWRHGFGCGGDKAGGIDDDKENVGQAQDVPDEDGGGPADEQDDNGAGGDGYIAPTSRDGKGAGELPLGVEIKKVNAHKPGEVEGDKAFRRPVGDSGSKTAPFEISKEEKRSQCEDDGGNDRRREDGEDLSFANQEGDEEPAGDHEGERSGANGARQGRLGQTRVH